MNSNKKIANSARIAGLLYLLAGSSVAFVHLYILPQLIVWNNAAETAQNIMSSEFLFRMGILTDLLGMACFTLVPVILYQIFKRVDKSQATLMAILCIVGITMACINVLNQIAVLILLSGSDYLSGFDTAQLHTLVMLFFDLHSYGFLIVHVFFGLWLLPLGLLVIKSGFLPKILGILLMFAMLGYLLEIFSSFLFPSYLGLISDFTAALEGIGELPFILWLLVKGIDSKQFEKHTQSFI